MKVVDINDISAVQMEATYQKEREIKQLASNIGKIGDRYQCNMKDIGMVKNYDLIYGHWCLGYLYEEDINPFL